MPRQKRLVGWANKHWLSNFYYANLWHTSSPQRVCILRFPYITNPRTKHIDKRSHEKIKVRITIEEIPKKRKRC